MSWTQGVLLVTVASAVYQRAVTGPENPAAYLGAFESALKYTKVKLTPSLVLERFLLGALVGSHKVAVGLPRLRPLNQRIGVG